MDSGGRNGVQPLLVGQTALRSAGGVRPCTPDSAVPRVRICTSAHQDPLLAPRTAQSQQPHAANTTGAGSLLLSVQREGWETPCP